MSTPAQDLLGVLSDAALRVLARAAKRPGECVCPTPGLWAASQTAVLGRLRRLDLITADGRPVLTELGRRVAAAYLGCVEIGDGHGG